jgi:predicted transcriptional regulator
MKIKHSKFKNTGILFELLVRQVASDTVSGKDSAAINLIRKHFSKSELAKEHKLYQALVGSKALTEGKAESLINATLEISSRLNRSALRKEKYNIIKDIRESYDLEEFFKSKINNYSQYAAAFNLIEAHNSLEFVEPSQVIENKVNLLEHITRKEVNKENVTDRVMEEYMSMDKGTRILVYKTLLERFNSKYSNMSNTQKSVLKEYINNISNTVKLREFVNNHFAAIRAELNKMNKTVTDKTVQIKINEVVNILKPLDKNQNVKDDNIMALLQFHQLIAELKSVK